MKRLLFVLGDYYPIASANGVCALHVQNELYNLGVESDVVCYGRENNAISTTQYGEMCTINHCSTTKKNRLKKLIRQLLYWPVNYKKDVKLYKIAIETMMARHHYDAVVNVVKPIEGALACSSIKNVVVYELDSLTNNGENVRKWRKMFFFRPPKYEKIIYDNARYIMHLVCHKKWYSKPRYNKYLTKSEFVDIPHIVDEGYRFTLNNSSKITFIYAGSLLSPQRTPDYAVQLFKRLSCVIDLNCLFFSRGNCEKQLQDAERETNGAIKACGYVAQKVLKSEMECADFFLSIEFKHVGEDTSIPSKIFSYMATGKPIVHISGGYNDTSIPYLEKYDNCIVINPEDDLGANTRKLELFIRNNKGKILPFEIIKQIFPLNTPEYTAQRIFSVIYQ